MKSFPAAAAFHACLLLLLAVTACNPVRTDKVTGRPATPPSASSSSRAAAASAEPVLLTEDQIGSLEQWQQDLLSDPGWNQPYIDPSDPVKLRRYPVARPYSAPAGRIGAEVYVDAAVNAEGREYTIATSPGAKSVSVRMRVVPHGGTPDAGGRYRSIVWAFRDGTILTSAQPFSQWLEETAHSYSLTVPVSATELIYVVRVMVVDAKGQTAFADSLPLVIQRSGQE